ncbi:hypothetical protein ABZW11_18235 [Nonomuraea sp. NPDC004580]|uniref:hypothetical protein n=1 Tax=Nonomuraea sp. NPDC004580 TaxID=3154552 RepID=UPI0033BC8350
MALGGPATYSASHGGETRALRVHSGNGPHEELDRRAIACFGQALDDVGLGRTSGCGRRSTTTSPGPPPRR